VLEAAARCDLLYLTGITLSLFGAAERQRWVGLAAEVRRRGGVVAFDPNYRPRGWADVSEARTAVESMAPYTSVVLTTDSDERMLFGSSDMAGCFSRWRNAGVEEIVLKRGAEGAAVQFGADVAEVAVPAAVQVIDSTGAGDSFNAAYLAARWRGRDIRQSAMAGNILAGAVVQVAGAILPVARMPASLSSEC
jgi:2-dehydro-3-deoxygluconokinase